MVTPMKSLYSRPNCTPQERVELEKCHISHGKVSTWSTSLRDGMTQGSPPNKATAMSEVPQPTPHSPRCLSVILRGLPQFLWVSPHFLEIFLICLEVFSNFWEVFTPFFQLFWRSSSWAFKRLRSSSSTTCCARPKRSWRRRGGTWWQLFMTYTGDLTGLVGDVTW